MSFPLPIALAAAIENMTAGSTRAEIAERAARVSAHYRDGQTSWLAIVSPEDVTAYLSVRMPAIFAAVRAALHAAHELMPSFSPATLLDLCAGPGTASFAALSLWPEISAVTLLDANSFFLKAAQFLGEACGVSPMRDAKLLHSALSGAGDELPSADLVVISYALVELPVSDITQIARQAWSRSNGILLFVEPGTPEGFRRILLCRDALIAQGAHLVAPCPHLEVCPMQPPAWCHFSERLARSRQHRLAKGAQANYEDEPYLYLAFARSPATLQPRGRIVSRVRVSKAELRFSLCREDGRLIEERTQRRDRAAYAKLRRAAWGHVVLPDEPRE